MQCKYFLECPLREFEEKGLINSSWRQKYCQRDFKNCERYRDVSRGIPHPTNKLPDGKIYKNLPEEI